MVDSIGDLDKSAKRQKSVLNILITGLNQLKVISDGQEINVC